MIAASDAVNAAIGGVIGIAAGAALVIFLEWRQWGPFR